MRKFQHLLSLAVLVLAPVSLLRAESLTLPTQTYNVSGRRLTIPNWNKITWASMPSLESTGYVRVPANLVQQIGYDPSRQWSAGQPIDTVLMLGDISDDFNVGSLSLNDVQRLLGSSNLNNLTLKNFGLVKNQTVASLVKAIPTLGSLDISQVTPIQDLAAQLGIVGEPGTINDALQAHPELETAKFADLNLSSYRLDSIPGLESAPVSAFAQWQQSYIKDIPGLSSVPLAKLAPKLVNSLLGGIFAIADNYFSHVEYGDPRVPAGMFVSGKQSCNGKNTPVAVSAGSPYAYIELTDFTGKGGPNYGKRIASGDDQQVNGGCGPLAIVNGGKEPTGWNAFGTSTFKLVLRGVDERQAKGEFWLNTHICAHPPFIGKTCTPYFLPVAPVFSVQYNDAVFLGKGI